MFLLLLLGCFNDCSYYERCDGDTLLVCGEGADQQVNRKVNEVPCEAPNDTCVEVGDSNATCAHASDPCEDGAPACVDGLLVVCEPFQSALGLRGQDTEVAFPQAYDCAATGQVCGADAEGEAACVDA